MYILYFMNLTGTGLFFKKPLNKKLSTRASKI